MHGVLSVSVSVCLRVHTGILASCVRPASRRRAHLETIQQGGCEARVGIRSKGVCNVDEAATRRVASTTLARHTSCLLLAMLVVWVRDSAREPHNAYLDFNAQDEKPLSSSSQLCSGACILSLFASAARSTSRQTSLSHRYPQASLETLAGALLHSHLPTNDDS